MKYDFNAIHNRKNTSSMKHDGHRRYGKRAGLIPLWVADMDFKAPIEVEEALANCARHGIYGYSETGKGYWEAVRGWFWEGFGYRPERKWMVTAPGVMFAVAVAVRAFTKDGDAVMIQRPVYPPFSPIVTDNRRKLVVNALVRRGDDSRYVVDFDDFERKIVENRVKMFILCNPHNPVGRAWKRSELERMGDICLKHGCLIVSDEIHCDFVFAPHRHHIFSTMKPEFAENSIICTAPSKTFNMPGLQVSNTFIQNPRLRKKFVDEHERSGYSQMNSMGLAACEAAYRYGRDWLGQLMEYLAGNMKLVYEFGERTGIRPAPLEGTYLAWLDFSPLGLPSQKEIDELVDKAGLWLSPGPLFGDPEGIGFQRINIGSPRPILEKALGRLEAVLR